MADYNKYPNASMKVSPDELEEIRDQANHEHRSISNYMRSIIMPETNRRRAERQPQTQAA